MLASFNLLLVAAGMPVYFTAVGHVALDLDLSQGRALGCADLLFLFYVVLNLLLNKAAFTLCVHSWGVGAG